MAIMTCRSKLVAYYLSKVFVVLYHEYNALNILPDKVKQLIQAIFNHSSDHLITCNSDIPYVVNTLNKNNLNYNLFCEFSTK